LSQQTRITESLRGIAPDAWNALAGDNPFLRHEFLSALHDTSCACSASGWSPVYLTLWENAALIGAMPLYAKAHSYGEYVFDWAWAEAYQRHGLDYYPKLLCAIPFTPVSGCRVLAGTEERRARLLTRALQLMRESRMSSLHCLLPPAGEAAEMHAQGMLLRTHVQFHWNNPGFASFDAFLASMNHDKRKKIKQERRKLSEAGIEFNWRLGKEISESDWKFFTRCYNRTYREHRSTPYLNLDFFQALGRCMPENLLLVVASLDGKQVASALNVYTSDTLYGRYWGALGYIPGLHFETCYYQAIEFCIERGIRVFEGGAQGEHKLARGFLPVKTYSAHTLAHPEFALAVGDYLRREAKGVERYIDELNESSPFKPQQTG
jgi:uncharacterized protein